MLELGGQIIDRLKAAALLDVGERVMPVTSIAEILSSQQPTTAVFVMFDGLGRPGPSPKGGHPGATVVDCDWLVIVAVRHAGQTSDTTRQALALASPVLRAVVAQLEGWKPALPQHLALEMIDPPAPGYLKGYTYLPLAFRCRQFLST